MHRIVAELEPIVHVMPAGISGSRGLPEWQYNHNFLPNPDAADKALSSSVSLPSYPCAV